MTISQDDKGSAGSVAAMRRAQLREVNAWNDGGYWT
jgi:hypothetical protein